MGSVPNTGSSRAPLYGQDGSAHQGSGEGGNDAQARLRSADMAYAASLAGERAPGHSSPERAPLGFWRVLVASLPLRFWSEV